MTTNSHPRSRHPYGRNSELIKDKPLTPRGPAPSRIEQSMAIRKLRAANSNKPCAAPDCTNLRRKDRNGKYCVKHSDRLRSNGSISLPAIKSGAVAPLRFIARSLLLDLFPNHPAAVEGMHVIRRLALLNRKDGRIKDRATLKSIGYKAIYSLRLGSYPSCARAFVAGDVAVRTFLANAVGIAMYLELFSPPEANDDWRGAQLGRLVHLAGPAKEVSTMLGKVRFRDSPGTRKREGKALLIGLAPLAKSITEQLGMLPRDFADFGGHRWHPHQIEEAALFAAELYNHPARPVMKLKDPPAADTSDTANRVRAALQRIRARARAQSTQSQDD